VLAASKDIGSRLPPLLTRDEAAADVLPAVVSLTADQETKQKTPSAPPSSLSIVLSQEMDRFNSLLLVIRTSLDELQRAIAGLVVMSQQLDEVYEAILSGEVPVLWTQDAYPSLRHLGGWVDDLIARVSFFRKWLTGGVPSVFWLPGFFFQQGFLTAVLQTYARKFRCPIDTLHFQHTVLDKSPEHLRSPPSDGVYVSGLYIEGAKWDSVSMQLDEGRHGEMSSPMPVIHLLPQRDFVPPPGKFLAPLYKTAQRYGVLSTTGHSTNFITAIALPTILPSDHWVLRGVALLCEPKQLGDE
jgi:dynein heavy chain